MPSSARTRPIPLQMASQAPSRTVLLAKAIPITAVGRHWSRGRRRARLPPDIGQGVNAALADVMLLSDAFDSAETISEVSFQRRRRKRQRAVWRPSCATRCLSMVKRARRRPNRSQRLPVGFPYQYPITREKKPTRAAIVVCQLLPSHLCIVEAPAAILLASGDCLSAAAAAIV